MYRPAPRPLMLVFPTKQPHCEHLERGEAQDRGLERLDILTLVFLRSLRMSARARRRSRAGIPIIRGADAGFVFSHGERGKCCCGRSFGRAH